DVERLGEILRDDRNETGGQPTLGHEDLPRACAGGDFGNAARGGDVFGEVEVAGAGFECRLRDAWIVCEAERRDYSLPAVQRTSDLLGVVGIEVERLDPGHLA